MKVGDKIKTIGSFAGMEGVVTRVREGSDPENHGLVVFTVTRTDDQKWRAHTTPVGEEEYFVHFEWYKHMEVINV